MGNCYDAWLRKNNLKVSTYKPPSFLENLKEQIMFQADFTWNTRLSRENIKRMISLPDGLASYACDTIIHNLCELTGTETDDVKDLFIGFGTGNPSMILENICDICVDKVQDFTGIEVPVCINLFKNICIMRWEDAKQDIKEIGLDVVCNQCGVEEEELKEFLKDPTAVTVVGICAGILKSQTENICPLIKYLPDFNINFRRRLIQLEPVVASTIGNNKILEVTTDSK